MQEIVAVHARQVTVQSVEGQGTTFTITLPVAIDDKHRTKMCAELPSTKDLACTHTATVHPLLWHAEVEAATYGITAVTEERSHHLAGVVSHKDWKVVTIEPWITEWSPIIPARPPEHSRDYVPGAGDVMCTYLPVNASPVVRVTSMVPPAPKGCV